MRDTELTKADIKNMKTILALHPVVTVLVDSPTGKGKVSVADVDQVARYNMARTELRARYSQEDLNTLINDFRDLRDKGLILKARK